MPVYFKFSVFCNEVRSMISDDQVDEKVANLNLYIGR